MVIERLRLRRGLFLGLLLLIPTLAAAQFYPYAPLPYWQQPARQPSRTPAPAQPQPQQGQIDPWRYRPQPPSHAQGVAPGYQPAPTYPAPGASWPNAAQPPWMRAYPGSQSTQAPATPLRLEWSVDDYSPYLHQPVLLTLHLIGATSPSSVSLELPQSADAALHQLDGPIPETRGRDFVNRFTLSLIPRRDGNLDLEPIRASGTLQGARGVMQRFSVATERSLRLQVRPAMPSVQPWLAARALRLDATLDHQGTLQPGQPVTLALEMQASGTTAGQLPSLQEQLQHPGLRVYRERVLSDTRLVDDGTRLLAERREYYTLVPQVAGHLILPELRLPWWNVERDLAEVTRAPLPILEVGNQGWGRWSTALGLNGGWISQLWMGLAAGLLVLIGYAIAVLARDPLLLLDWMALLWRRLRGGLTLLWRGLCRGAAQLRPAPAHTARLTRWRLSMLPRSSRLMHSVRRANAAKTPAEWWCGVSEELRERLVLTGPLTPASLGAHLCELRPGVDPEQIDCLMCQLDAARYGQGSLDFARWKTELMRQLGRRPRLARRMHGYGHIRWAALPPLNPEPLE